MDFGVFDHLVGDDVRLDQGSLLLNDLASEPMSPLDYGSVLHRRLLNEVAPVEGVAETNVLAADALDRLVIDGGRADAVQSTEILLDFVLKLLE